MRSILFLPFLSLSSAVVVLSLLPEIGARSIDDAAPRDFAIDLNNSIFDAYLRDSPASFAIVEFFANWCPACRNYKPQYEKVARLFNGADAVHPGIILMARVDCALKINLDLCDRFSISHYPSLFWGSPVKFASGRWDSKNQNEIHVIDDIRPADHLLNWINKRLGSSFNLDDEKYENEDAFPRNTSDPDEIARAIYDVEEATSKAFELIVQNKLVKPNTQAPLIKFLQLLIAHHPSERCRRGSAEILVNFDTTWPSEYLLANAQEATASQRKVTLDHQICGKEVPRGYWIFCRGSRNDTRGFSCGLWVLFHSLSVRVLDGESNFAFTAICDFIQNFFVCDECRLHFQEMSSRVSLPFNTSRDLALWLWSAHNKVNERLMKEEQAFDTGDPRFPKIIWPPTQLCPSCYLSSSRKNGGIIWNKKEVYKFLVDYYGRTLAWSPKDSTLSSNKIVRVPIDDAASTNAVPVGAALAIALASCAFGALACFWRAQQKNRKQRKGLIQAKCGRGCNL